MTYELEVTTASGRVSIQHYESFDSLSAAIDAALASPGFVRYEVRPGGAR
jgi:hypothetical protein